MGDYFGHWLSISKRANPEKLPRVFYVNWFRKSPNGSWLWPGYGENSRVLKWIFERCAGTAKAIDTPIGRLPEPDEIDIRGLDIPAANLSKLLSVDVQGWLAEVPHIRDYFAGYGDRMPSGLKVQVEQLEQRLRSA